jgi:DNA-binding transcriptional LysR family regulator
MLPSTESLRCFVSAAKLLNFRAAAKVVALTPAAFGQRIKQLEEQLGAPLFKRTTRSVRLTEAGLAMLPHAEKCLLFAGECARVGSGEARMGAMDIVLGTRHELGLSWILPQMDALTRAQPFLQLHLYFGSGSDLLLRVRTMEIDCAVTSTRFTDPKLESARLHREDYVFVGAASLLRERPLSRAEHAAEHTLLDIDARLSLFAYWRDAPAGGDRLHFARIVRLGTIEAIRQRVAAGAGVAVLPAYLVRREVASGAFRKVLPSVVPTHDYFRLVFRADDPRRTIYETMANDMLATPLG